MSLLRSSVIKQHKTNLYCLCACVTNPPYFRWNYSVRFNISKITIISYFLGHSSEVFCNCYLYSEMMSFLGQSVSYLPRQQRFTLRCDEFTVLLRGKIGLMCVLGQGLILSTPLQVVLAHTIDEIELQWGKKLI